MSTKEKLIERISHIEDESLLKDLLQMIEVELSLQGEVVKLTDRERAALDEGLNDLGSGKVFTNQEARKIVDEWLKTR